MKPLTDIEQRMLTCIAAGEPFTADDVTDHGQITIDAHHKPNQQQNGIGSLFRLHSADNHIRATGRVVASRAPHRKGGMIREWQPTSHGSSYARWRLDEFEQWKRRNHPSTQGINP